MARAAKRLFNAAEGNTILKRERKNEQWYNQKTDCIE